MVKKAIIAGFLDNRIKMWKKLSSKEILKHPRLTVIEDKVLLPNNEKTTYLTFTNENDCVLVIAKSDDGKILLQKEYSYPQNQELYQFPAGFMNSDEAKTDAVNRELKEESGFQANNLKLIGKFLLNNRRSKTMVFVYLGTDIQTVTNGKKADIEEDIKTYWYSEEEIEDLIINGDIQIFPVLSAWTLYKLNKLTP